MKKDKKRRRRKTKKDRKRGRRKMKKKVERKEEKGDENFVIQEKKIKDGDGRKELKEELGMK